MQITKREFLKRLGLGGAALAGGAALGDKAVKTRATLPPGSCGDPDNVWFGKNIFPLEHTMTDGPSCVLKDGKILQPAREIPIFHTTDVVVVGGGPAGFAAAIAAARTGAKVALVERYGSLGGLFTNGMVLIMLCTSAREDGKFRLVTKGLVEEFAHRARALGPHVCTGPVPVNRHWQPVVDPEGAKYLMDTMVAEEKIDMFFHCWGVDTVQDGDKVLGVVFESKQGRQAILAKQVVDCTGDADVLFQAGGDYKQITHGIGHVVRLANMDRIWAKQPPKGASRTNKWPMRSNEANPCTWWGNCGTGPKGNGLDVRDLTAAEIDFRNAPGAGLGRGVHREHVLADRPARLASRGRGARGEPRDAARRVQSGRRGRLVRPGRAPRGLPRAVPPARAEEGGEPPLRGTLPRDGRHDRHVPPDLPVLRDRPGGRHGGRARRAGGRHAARAAVFHPAPRAREGRRVPRLRAIMKVTLNPDAEVVKTVKEGLKRTGGYCPCRLQRTPETKCMCQEFRDQIKDPNFEGFCHCLLYYKSL